MKYFFYKALVLTKYIQSLQDFETIQKSYEEIVSHLPCTIDQHNSVNNNTSSNGNDITNSAINPNIINNRGEPGLEAITRLQKFEKILKDGIERRAKQTKIEYLDLHRIIEYKRFAINLKQLIILSITLNKLNTYNGNTKHFCIFF